MASSSYVAVLHFDRPWGVEEDDLLICSDGEIEVIVDPRALEDWVAKQAQQDQTYGSDPEIMRLTVEGVRRPAPFREPSSVICTLQGGKDAWHQFNDYPDVVDAIACGIGTLKAKYRAIRMARKYWYPRDDDDCSAWDEADKAARQTARDWNSDLRK